MNITKPFRIFFIFLFILLFSSYSTFAYYYTWSTLDSTLPVSSNIISDESNPNPLNLDCGSCILMDQHTGTILYSYNSHDKLRPASVTKLMSIYLVMEAIKTGKLNYDTPIPCSEKASSMGGSQIWLDTTETLTVDEMLKAVFVVSANDCITALSEYVGGTEENFVKMMNDKAKELGMNDSCFKNCHGIDEDGHEMSSYDIAIISKELLNNFPEITKYTTIWHDTLRNGKSELINTNKLVRNYKGCTGLKTGSTSSALFNLSASATRDDFSLIAVVMKAPSSAIRFESASKLLDYGFNNFENKKLVSSGDKIKTIEISKGTKSYITAIASQDCSHIIPKGTNVNIEQSVVVNPISCPIKQGDTIGTINYTLNNEIIANCELISDSNVDKLNISSMEKFILKKWFYLLRI